MDKGLIGSMTVELQEIEKINQCDKDSVEVLQITYGSGGFWTVLCCTP